MTSAFAQGLPRFSLRTVPSPILKIGILTQYYPPELGAPQGRLAGLASAIVARGHFVYVLTAMPNYPRGEIYPGYGGLVKREEIAGTTVWRSYVYPTRSVAGYRRLANYFSFVASSMVAGSFVLPSIDFLITESPPLFLGISGFALSKLKRARWIFNVSDLWPESVVHLGIVRRGLSLAAAERLEAFCYRQAWLVSGQSKEILESVHRRFPLVATYHLSNGVDTSFFGPHRRSSEARAKLTQGLEATCIAVYAGLHGAAQGLEQVLEAASRLGDLEDVAIVFIGDGPEKKALVARARERRLTNVKFLEPVSRDNIAALVGSADVAIVPLATWLPGAVPSKLYEAMGSGIPVVLMAKGEAVDILEAAEAGIAVDPRDVDSLAKVLRDLSHDAALRARLGANGRTAAVASYDRSSIGERFVKFLEEQKSC